MGSPSLCGVLVRLASVKSVVTSPCSYGSSYLSLAWKSPMGGDRVDKAYKVVIVINTYKDRQSSEVK